MDRIVKYASEEIQNWEFKQELSEFKKELIDSVDITSEDANIEIDKKTDEFLRKFGINITIDESEVVDD